MSIKTMAVNLFLLSKIDLRGVFNAVLLQGEIMTDIQDDQQRLAAAVAENTVDVQAEIGLLVTAEQQIASNTQTIADLRAQVAAGNDTANQTALESAIATIESNNALLRAHGAAITQAPVDNGVTEVTTEPSAEPVAETIVQPVVETQEASSIEGAV